MIRVKYIQTDDNREIAYFPETRRFFFVNDEAKDYIQDIASGENSKDALLCKYKIDSETYDRYYEQITEHIKWKTSVSADGEPLKEEKLPNSLYGEDSSCEECEKQNESHQKKTLGRLVIHLANDCNLRCVYCYANGGVYKSKHDILKREMADKIIDAFFNQYDEIEHIQFFGGEPLLNMDMLEYICG